MVKLILQYLQKSHILTSVEQTSEQEFTSGSSLLHPRETETLFGIVFVFKSSSLQDWDVRKSYTHSPAELNTEGWAQQMYHYSRLLPAFKVFNSIAV